MKLYVKNMVCKRCIAAVEKVMVDNGLHPTNIVLGEVHLAEENIGDKKAQVIADLETLGFEWIDDRKERMVEAIKALIVELVQDKDNKLEINLSDYLSKHLHYEYTTISNLFSELNGITIEKYYIAQKIEKVKELLFYDELSLSEISDRLHYSSVAHLSSQFKKVTGRTPSDYKKLEITKRKPLDEV
ncbi:MAG: AraC family transcriptional regulator [Sphingobacteriales bacterium]|nr:MAG: AraC family transcriptional regulator [Sphingobacteriales bacterium]